MDWKEWKVKIGSKDWKDRLSGYEEVMETIRGASEEALVRYAGLVRPLVGEINPQAQVRAFEAACLVVDGLSPAALSSSPGAELLSALLDKGFGGTARPPSRETVQNTFLRLARRRGGAAPLAAVLARGCAQKNARLVVPCLEFSSKLLRDPDVPLAPLMSEGFLPTAVQPCITHGSKEVRSAALDVLRVLSAHADPAAAPLAASFEVPPAQMLEWTPPSSTPRQTRVSRLPSSETTLSNETSREEPEPLLFPAESETAGSEFVWDGPFLARLDAAWFAQLRSSKWSERKEALDLLVRLLELPSSQDCKVSAAELEPLVHGLLEALGDGTPATVPMVLRALGLLAQNHAAALQPSSGRLVCALTAQLKEKRAFVLHAVHETLRTVHGRCFRLADVAQELAEGPLASRLPEVRRETLLWVEHCIETSPSSLGDDELLPAAAQKLTEDAVASVREAARSVLAAVKKYMGEARLPAAANSSRKSCAPSPAKPAVVAPVRASRSRSSSQSRVSAVSNPALPSSSSSLQPPSSSGAATSATSRLQGSAVLLEDFENIRAVFLTGYDTMVEQVQLLLANQTRLMQENEDLKTQLAAERRERAAADRSVECDELRAQLLAERDRSSALQSALDRLLPPRI